MTDETTTDETETKAKPGRPVSALLAATRAYENAHRRAEKARAAVAKVQPLVDQLNELEAEEETARQEYADAVKAAGIEV